MLIDSGDGQRGDWAFQWWEFKKCRVPLILLASMKKKCKQFFSNPHTTFFRIKTSPLSVFCWRKMGERGGIILNINNAYYYEIKAHESHKDGFFIFLTHQFLTFIHLWCCYLSCDWSFSVSCYFCTKFLKK